MTGDTLRVGGVKSKFDLRFRWINSLEPYLNGYEGNTAAFVISIDGGAAVITVSIVSNPVVVGVSIVDEDHLTGT